MDTTAQTISHCIAFANSTKQAVGFACQVSQGDSIRADIKAGKYEGVSFPEPRKGKWKGTKSKIPEATRRADGRVRWLQPAVWRQTAFVCPGTGWDHSRRVLRRHRLCDFHGIRVATDADSQGQVARGSAERPRRFRGDVDRTGRRARSIVASFSLNPCDDR